MNFYFNESISWSKISSGSLALRYFESGFIFDVAGCSIFGDKAKLYYFLALLNSNLKKCLIDVISPTMNYEVGQLSVVPIIFPKDKSIEQILNLLAQENINISKDEWNSRETSWNFKKNELFVHKDDSNLLEVAYNNYCKYWKAEFFKLHQNEEELNQFFIDIYDLNDELDNKVPLKEITILKEESEIKDNELVFKKEVVIKQFLSYVVGCIFGRYNPEKEGLMLANKGDTLNNCNFKFKPDDDNIIPITDKNYFSDDIVGKVKEFLKVYFGNETISENIDFIASGLKGSGSSEDKIRHYFLKDFFKDHCKTYKKRPIYWLFTSGKEQGFNVLVYMHRYNKETLAKIRTDYLLKLQDKLISRIDLIEEDSIEKSLLRKQSLEIKKYDLLLNHEAIKYIDIDLDDGVTVNYAKFKELLKKI
jgi:hypothetical protein